MNFFFKIISKIFPYSLLFKILRRLISGKVNSMNLKLALKELLVFDNYLKNEIASVGTNIGGGKHIKHEIMKYHRFFSQNILPNQRVLDVGCGNAFLAISVLKDVDCKITGVEICNSNFKLAKKNTKHTSIKIIQADATKFKYKNSFDIIILSNVLEHIKNRVSFLKTLKTQVKPKKILIRVPVLQRDWTVLKKKEIGVEWRLDNTHEIEYTKENFEKEMLDAGLKIKKIEFIWSEIWCVLV